MVTQSLIKVDVLKVNISVVGSHDILGKYYGTTSLNLSKYDNVIGVVPISASNTSVNGTNGVLGRYTDRDTLTWAITTPIAGTYVCEFLILYTSLSK